MEERNEGLCRPTRIHKRGENAEVLSIILFRHKVSVLCVIGITRTFTLHLIAKVLLFSGIPVTPSVTNMTCTCITDTYTEQGTMPKPETESRWELLKASRAQPNQHISNNPIVYPPCICLGFHVFKEPA